MWFMGIVDHSGSFFRCRHGFRLSKVIEKIKRIGITWVLHVDMLVVGRSTVQTFNRPDRVSADWLAIVREGAA